MDDYFAEELKTYAAHRDDLIERGRMKFVLIKGDTVAGIFETQIEAMRVGYQTFGLERFLTKRITATPEDEYWASCRIGC